MEKEVSEVERKRLVKKKYIDKINSELSRDIIVQQEVYSLVRGFFSELLKLDYEFTYEELSTELNKIFLKSALKEEIEDFLYDLSESEYLLEKDLEQEQIRGFVMHLQNIIKSMIYDIELQTSKPSFFEKIFKRNKKSVTSSSLSLPSFGDTLQNISNPGTVTSENIVPNSTIPSTMNSLSQGISSANSVQSNTISTNTNMIVNSENVTNHVEDNELFTKKLFEDYGTSDIESDTQESNILLTVDDDSATIDSAKASSDNIVTGEKKVIKKEVDTPVIGSKSPISNPQIKSKKYEDNILLIEDNSPDMVTMHELMEESYLQMHNFKIDNLYYYPGNKNRYFFLLRSLLLRQGIILICSKQLS